MSELLDSELLDSELLDSELLDSVLLFNILPVEILLIILENYMTDKEKMFLTKTEYEKTHKKIFAYYPKLKERRFFVSYCHLLAKHNCYYIINLLLRDNPDVFYDPKKDMRLYYINNAYMSFFTYMRAIALNNKSNETYVILDNIVTNKIKEQNRNKQTISNREKKNFKTKKYIREWGN